MVLQFSNTRDRRREVKKERPAPAQAELLLAPAHAALAACRAELLAIARNATVLAQLGLDVQKEKPRQGGTWGPGLEPAHGLRGKSATVAANGAEHMADSLYL